MSPLFISLLVVLVGFLLSFGGSWFRDSRREKGDKRAVAQALLVEVRNQAAWCRTRGSWWNRVLRDDTAVTIKALRADRPPRQEVYDALVGRMTQFEPDEVTAITAFYGAVEAVRARIDDWGGQPEEQALDANDVKDLAQRWRETCRTARAAIETLERNLEDSQSPHESVEKDAFHRDLRRVAEGGILLSHSSAAGAEPRPAGDT